MHEPVGVSMPLARVLKGFSREMDVWDLGFTSLRKRGY